MSALTALEAALDDAGVDPATYDREDPPEDLTDAEQDRIEAAAERARGPQTPWRHSPGSSSRRATCARRRCVCEPLTAERPMWLPSASD